jgi:hypothetical protein
VNTSAQKFDGVIASEWTNFAPSPSLLSTDVMAKPSSGLPNLMQIASFSTTCPEQSNEGRSAANENAIIGRFSIETMASLYIIDINPY